MTVNDNEFAHVVRVNSLRVHLLAMLVSLIRFAHGKMLPSVASISFAVNCSLWSRQSFALLMGNAPAGRVIHSLRSWGNAPAGRVSHSLRSWGNAHGVRVSHSLRSWGNAHGVRVSHSLRSC